MVLRLCIFAAFLLFIACSEPSFDNPTDPRNISHPSNIAYESFTDARDGQTYKSVVIGTQTWMAENLNYNASGSYCVDNVKRTTYYGKDTTFFADTLVAEGGYCDIYGRLYDWNTAITICPSGWHLPSNAEWGVLEKFVGGFASIGSDVGGDAGRKLKSASGWAKGNGEDTYGFTALPAGGGERGGILMVLLGVGSMGNWWSTEEFDRENTYAYIRSISEREYVGSSRNYKSDFYSVRCVKDGLCGSQPFNSGTQFCNGNSVYSLCSGKEYDPATQRCGTGNVVETKCGTGWYEETIQRCGTGNVVETKCGTEWYNATIQQCVGNIIETKCGTGWYNEANTNLRCESGIVETKCGTGWYNALTQRCGTGNVVETKCGSGWLDAKVYFCFNNTSYQLCNGKEYNPTNQRCESNVVETKCGTEWYNENAQFCDNSTIYSLCSGKKYDNVNQRCESNVLEIKCGTEWYNEATHFCSDGTVKEYGTITDTRDNKTYKITEIGTQTWMAENLNYATDNSKCYDDNITNCATYGRLYDWSTAMGFDASCNSTSCNSQIQPKHKGVCPSGWHIPSNAEWDALIAFIHTDKGLGSFTSGTSIYAGKYLKATSGWNDDYKGKSGNGTDTYGFSALPGGSSYSDGSFRSVGTFGGWWSANEAISLAYFRGMYYDDERVFYGNPYKDGSHSVRCLED